MFLMSLKVRVLDHRLALCVAGLAFVACGDDASESNGGSISASGFVTSAGITAGVSASGSASDSDSDGSSGSDSGDSNSGDATSESGSSTSGDPTSDSSSGSTTEPTSTTNPTSGTTTSGTSDAPTSDGSDSDTEGSCAEVKVEAENKKQPADIIFVIDNSGSMEYEEGEVKSHMNEFSSQIIDSGIDAHVVLLSNNNICIGAPLGSGQCPNDSKEPNYLHVNVGIGSNNALSQLLSTVDEWQDMMRPDGAKHVIVVSDDDSNMGAGTFSNEFKALGPSYQDYKFHAIVGTWDAGDVLKCVGDAFCCATIADEGKVYMSLVSMTGGVLGPLCDGGNQKFDELFDTLSTEVVQEATIACEWEIPEPMGMEIDFGKVNVDYLDGMGDKQPIPKVDGADACGDLEAWYYDDEDMPTKIFACPTLCMKIQGNKEAKVDVKFGCESLIPQ